MNRTARLVALLALLFALASAYLVAPVIAGQSTPRAKPVRTQYELAPRTVYWYAAAGLLPTEGESQ